MKFKEAKAFTVVFRLNKCKSVKCHRFTWIEVISSSASLVVVYDMRLLRHGLILTKMGWCLVFIMNSTSSSYFLDVKVQKDIPKP